PPPPPEAMTLIFFVPGVGIYFPELLKIFVFNKRPENLASPKPTFKKMQRLRLTGIISGFYSGG
ncbi:hypothetical protein, partial [Escherichia coli]|uniref:hypothetical protein n=1 Tax=Escherichia coli TaxID=562 RepID=UPI00273F1202